MIGIADRLFALSLGESLLQRTNAQVRSSGYLVIGFYQGVTESTEELDILLFNSPCPPCLCGEYLLIFFIFNFVNYLIRFFQAIHRKKRSIRRNVIDRTNSSSHLVLTHSNV